MVVYTREKIKLFLKIDFIRFCIVGGSGFVINFVLLNILHHVLGLQLFMSQLIGAEVALFSNALLHHHWTYRSKHTNKSFKNTVSQFHLTSWPAIIGSAFMVDGGVRYLHLSSLGALILSSFIVLIWNYIWSKYVIWNDVTNKDIKELVK